MATKKKRPAVKAPKRKAAPPPAPREAEQTAFRLAPHLIERALVTGDSRGLLEDYFGPDSYNQLRDMARDAATRSVRGGPRVLILPGIMGSTLAREGPLGLEDVLWIDPVEVALGRLTELKLNGSS